MPIRVLSIALLAPLAGACGQPHDGPHDAATDTGLVDSAQPCGVAFLGDPAAPVDLQLRVLEVDGTDAPLADGDAVPLTFPPQGGRVVFIGVKATNLDPCFVQLSGAVRDLQTRQVRIDSRTANLIPTGDGWGTSGKGGNGFAAIASYANIPLCPNQWSATNVYGTTYELSATVKDRAGRTATRTTHVVPQCAEPARLSECMCICKAGYVLGETCASDAGASDAADDAASDAATDAGTDQ